MPDDALYQSIAQRYGFHLPDEHREMSARGFFKLDHPSHASEFTSLANSYLWLNDMEWYSLQEIADFTFPDIYEPHLPNLVPFAFNGAGDYWCLQTDKTDERGTRVLLCPHDYALARIYAPSFPAALYRQVLEYACYGTDFDRDRGQNRAFLHR